jgi:hypothetical protein
MMTPRLPSSGATVTTAETLAECKIAVRSFQMTHPGVPVFVACTTPEVQAAMAGPGVTALLMPLEPLPAAVKLHNVYHRPDAIRLKMAIMRAVLTDPRQCHDVLFFDADLIFQAPVFISAHEADVMLSLNLSVTPDMQRTVAQFGLFNAGLVWTRSLEFVDWWEREYLDPSKPGAFYEQTALGLAPAKFATDYFPTWHNWGFWRGGLGKRQVGSFHVHLGDGLFMTDYIRKGTLALRPAVWSRMRPELASFAHEALGHPKRIFFLHYGKAAGVYTDRAFRTILRGYDHHNSWQAPHSLGRDWTPEELQAILTREDDGCHYLHQHHSSLTREQVELAKANGWRTVMFYRDPRAILCSLYHFGLRIIRERGKVLILGEETADLGTWEEFFTRALAPENRRLWALPEWAGLVDHCQIFSEAALDAVMQELTGSLHLPMPPANASENPGWQQMLTEEQAARLAELPEYCASLEWINAKTQRHE